jgi:hypothetical protein
MTTLPDFVMFLASRKIKIHIFNKLNSLGTTLFCGPQFNRRMAG